MARPDRIETAGTDERSQLEALMRRSTDVWPAYRAQLAAHPEAIEVPGDQLAAGYVRVARGTDDETLGFSIAVPHEHGDGWELDGLFVAVGRQGAGIGRALVEDVVARGRAAGVASISVIAGPEAEAFYERVGFVRVGTAETRFGPAVTLRLAL